jgi:hypothetical protein
VVVVLGGVAEAEAAAAAVLVAVLVLVFVFVAVAVVVVAGGGGGGGWWWWWSPVSQICALMVLPSTWILLKDVKWLLRDGVRYANLRRDNQWNTYSITQKKGGCTQTHPPRARREKREDVRVQTNLVANSTPMVDLDSRLNSFLVNRESRLDLPTPESPISTTASRAGGGRWLWWWVSARVGKTHHL